MRLISKSLLLVNLKLIKMKYSTNIAKSIFLFLPLVLTISKANGQQNGNYPVSTKIFSPFIFNPAITGSKDFLSIDIIGSYQKKNNPRLICENSRLSIKKKPRYFSSGADRKFLSVGVGGSIFRAFNGLSRNTGIGGSFSYHIPLGSTLFSYLSFGVSLKGVYHEYIGNKELNLASKNSFHPSADFGLYFYRSNLFAGISATDLLGKQKDSDSLNSISIAKQYHFLVGYKLILSHADRIVLEPSIMIITDDSLSFNVKKNFNPTLKLYLGGFCIGTYLNDYDKITLFFQFRYPRFYVGTFLEIPKKTPYYKKPMTAEFALGIIIPGNKTGIRTNNHW